jgi:hypothetical protein
MKSTYLSLLTVSVALLVAGTSTAAVVTLQPVDDAYLISSGSQADQTWNSPVLEQFGYYGAFKRPLFKFDLSSIPDGATILSARLTIALQGIYGGQGHSTTVWRMPNDNWYETNVTWNSYPQTGAVVVASLPGTGQLGDRVWHIQLADWPYAADLADDAVTFQTRWDADGYGGSEGDGYYKANSYSSKEGTVAPTLQIEFTPPPSPFTYSAATMPVGDSDSGPDCLATADVNGDGRLDLISANYGFRWANPGEPGGWGTNVVVLTNNGSGGFALNATLSVGAGPSSVVAVDFNGDGWPDVVSANQSGNTLTVLTNNGEGGLGWQTTLAINDAPSSLVAADVNGDWALDLACVRSGANAVTVLTNDGRGRFVAQGAFAVGAKPIFLVTTDVNDDARPDLVSVNHDAGSLTVLTNNGSGFGFNATLAVGSIPVAAAAGDVNQDGQPDLVCANWGANTLTVLTNHGASGFGVSATLPVGATPSSVVVGDFNGDGAADLICANTSTGAGNSLTIYTNSGSGSFGLQDTLLLGNIPTSLLAADVNGDGRLDVNFLNFRDGTLTVLLNTTAFPPAFSSRALTISRQDGGVRVAWPSASPGWSLQQKRDLTARHWLPSGHDGYPFTDDRTNQSLSLPAANAGRFFRLLHP